MKKEIIKKEEIKEVAESKLNEEAANSVAKRMLEIRKKESEIIKLKKEIEKIISGELVDSGYNAILAPTQSICGSFYTKN